MTGTSVGFLLHAGIERLRMAGSDSPRLDAELLLGHVLGIDRVGLIAHSDAPVGADAAAAYEATLQRRIAGEPVAYIRGFKEFHGVALSTDARALIPRPETEALVDLVIPAIIERLVGTPRPAGTPPLRLIDVGTGAGTIAIAVAAELRRRRMDTDVAIIATDASPDALQLARENAVGHGVADRIQFQLGDLVPWDATLFDVVAANLPYIPTGAIEGLPVAASFEPRMALDGGPDGLDLIRRLLEQLARVLSPEGAAFLEIGSEQGPAVLEATTQLLPGWHATIVPDLAGLDRVLQLEPAAGSGLRPRPTGAG
ncbi:MAG TPA: peptide chain release factor N(5)-glutamine methyltransferase [Candidatus Limnocylindrales bacterium]